MNEALQELAGEAAAFLRCPTPAAWIDVAAKEIPTLLIDHANCEKKAASTAMGLMYRYVDKPDLLEKMSQLAREELLHFEQVVGTLRDRNIPYLQISPARYASSLRKHIRADEPYMLVDVMIIGAFIEARSCERFAALAPRLDAGLRRFYQSLLRSEARHFTDYLALAHRYSPDPIGDRVAFFAEREAELIRSEDGQFRFHSGLPVANYSLQ